MYIADISAFDPFFAAFFVGFFVGIAITLGCLWLSAFSREAE